MTMGPSTPAALDQFAPALQAYNAGRLEEAQAICLRRLAVDPGDADTLQLLGLLRGRTGAMSQGVALIQLAIDQQPACAQYWFNLGVSLQEMGRLEEACGAYEYCLLLEPLHRDACNNYAEVVRRAERFTTALAFYDRMESQGLALRGLQLQRAIALAGLGYDAEAEAAFRRSLREEPGLPTASWEFSQLLLRQQKFEEGWHHYERRFDAPHLLLMDCARLPVARWTGQSLDGKTILVHREQGLGDQIMYASVLPDLLERGAQVWLDVAPALRQLFAHSFPRARQLSLVPGEWPEQLETLPDFEVPIGSLCQPLRPDTASFPARAYLRAAEATCSQWRERLRQSGLMEPGMRRVGVVWTTNPARGLWGPSRRARRKTMAPAQFAPLCGGDIRLVSLHNQPALDEAGGPLPFEIADFHAHLVNLHETAALVSCMDLVVTVDTAVAHLAAAMGKPTWILLQAQADWRWGVDAKTSYWYEHVRLFRQAAPGQWEAVMQAVAAALASGENTIDRVAAWIPSACRGAAPGASASR